MSVINTTIYKCDVCGAEYTEKWKIIKESVPCYGYADSFTNASIDLCVRCRSALRKAIKEHFAEIKNDYWVRIKRK